jgi:hypothetical protein
MIGQDVVQEIDDLDDVIADAANMRRRRHGCNR